MPRKRIEHIDRETAITNAVRWALESNWTLAMSAQEMGLNTATLRGWLHQAGWSCEYRRIWTRKETGR